MSQIINLKCNRCNEQTQHEIAIQNHKINVKCKKCNVQINGGHVVKYRFPDKDSNAWCNSCNSETYHLVYIINDNFPTIFCTSCGKELIVSRDHKRICGININYCQHCKQTNSIFNYIDLLNNNHFFCLLCEQDNIIGLLNECPDINKDQTDIMGDQTDTNENQTVLNNNNNNRYVIIPY